MFIKTNLKKSRQDELLVILVDDLQKKYTEPSKLPRGPTHSPSPFEGKDAKECLKLLRKLVQDTGSEIDLDQFAVIDQRSVEDGTVLIAQAFESERVETVRAILEETDRLLTNLMVAGISIGELQETARKSKDGVWGHHK